jgi:histidyl-tRNA synthetase
VVIIGSEELQRSVATLKDMRSGEQREVSFEELASAL